jgi:predicted amidohydrolase
MIIHAGIAQIPNSSDLDRNFRTIFSMLERFEHTEVRLVVFPECSLSGFTAQMQTCTPVRLEPYFLQIETWVAKSGIEVVLPTAISDNGRIFNSGRWFRAHGRTPFFKIGLTESEKKYFSIPEDTHPKVFVSNGFRFAVLICADVAHLL